MNYDGLSLLELKQHAKERKYIKLYYVLSKEELIRILSLPEPPLQMTLSKRTIKQLRDEAKSRGIRGFWNLSRAELLALLHPSAVDKTASDKNQQNQSHADEHNDPQRHDAQ